MPWVWAQRHLTKSHNYWLIKVRPNATPHAMPVWGIWVEAVFYFSTARESRKARNLARNPRCVVCTERAPEAVIVEGVAKEIKDEKLLARLARPYHAKYKPWKLDPAPGPVYAVRPRVASGCRRSALSARPLAGGFETRPRVARGSAVTSNGGGT